jgi:hypothetical protein
MTDALLTRLHAALATALVERGHDDFRRPIRVLDIYKDLIPYSVVRAPLGLALNADYEHALLRLLSGEGGLIRLEPAAARDELRREAESQNPRTALYRKFAHSPVLVTASGRGPGGSAAGRVQATPKPERPAAETVSFPFDPPEREAPPAGAPDRAPRGSERASSGAERPTPEAAEEPSFAGQPCAFCPETLPDDPRVRFCPYCGADQGLLPCERCGAVLERGWRYCISCGHEPGR